MADRNGAVVRPWMKQAEEAKLKSEAEKAAAAKAAFEATFKDVDKINSLPDPLSSSDSEAEEAEDRLACKPIGPTEPGRCTAAGPGMGGGAACAPCTFTVTTMDSDGRKIPDGGADIKVKVTPGASVGGSDIEGIVKDQGDGTYAVTYVVPKKGNYMVKVECNGKPIMGSPFPVFFSAGSATGGLLGLAPTTTYPHLVNQNMPNMPNYSASVSGAFPGLLGMIPGLVPGPSGGVILPGVGASLGEVCREYLNGQCFKTDCKFNHPQHNLLMAAIAATTNMGSLSQAPMPPSAAAMAAAQAIMAAQALQAHASQHAQSQILKDSAGTSDKERKADALKKTLQVSNLSPVLTVDQLKQLFGFYGTVVDCTITDSKHFAYIEYSKPEEAAAALALNNMDVGGRPLNVEMAKSLPPKPVMFNSSLGSSSLPIMMQQAVAMQQMQFQQALMVQQTMAAQQAANRAATVKSATEIASARAAEISRRLNAEGLGNDDKETNRKSRSPSISCARSKSRSRSPIHPRRRMSRSSSPVSHRARDKRSKSPVRSRHKSRSLSPLVRRSRNHRSRSPLRSRHYSNYDDYGRWSYRDSRDGSGRFRRYDSRGSRNHHSFVSRRRSRSTSPRGRKSYRDDSDLSKHRRPRSPGRHRGSRTSPFMEDEDKLRHRRSRSTSVDSRHRSKGRREEKKKPKNRARRRSKSISPEGKNRKVSLSPLSSDENKSKHHKRSRSSSRSSDTKYRSNNRDGECKGGELKNQEKRSKSTECKDIKTASTRRSDKNKSKERRRSRSKSVDGDRESEGNQDWNRHGKRKHQERRRSRSPSADLERPIGRPSCGMDKLKHKYRRHSRSKSAGDKHESDDSIDAGGVKSNFSQGRSAGTDHSSEEPKDSEKDVRELADDGVNFSCEQGSSLVETGKVDTQKSTKPVIDRSDSRVLEGTAENCA